MRCLLILIVLLIEFAGAQDQKDYDARERLIKLEQQYSALKERQIEIKAGVDKVNEKLEIIINGSGGKPGINEQIALNTQFRQEMQKLIWGLISAIAIQFCLTLLNFNRLRKLIKG